MKNNIDIKELIDEYLVANKNDTLQVYEEIIALGYWLQGFKPNNILEIGVHKGGTFWLISKLSTGKKVAMNLIPIDDILSEFMDKEDDWKLFVGNSQTEESFNKVKEFCNQFDFIFIDGDHTYDGVKRDFNLYKQLLSPRGFIAFHDIDPDHVHADNFGGQVYKFWEELNEGTKLNLICTKSCGKIKSQGNNEHFGGIGIWRP